MLDAILERRLDELLSCSCHLFSLFTDGAQSGRAGSGSSGCKEARRESCAEQSSLFLLLSV